MSLKQNLWVQLSIKTRKMSSDTYKGFQKRQDKCHPVKEIQIWTRQVISIFSSCWQIWTAPSDPAETSFKSINLFWLWLRALPTTFALYSGSPGRFSLGKNVLASRHKPSMSIASSQLTTTSSPNPWTFPLLWIWKQNVTKQNFIIKVFNYVKKLENWEKMIWPSVSIFGLEKTSHCLY